MRPDQIMPLLLETQGQPVVRMPIQEQLPPTLYVGYKIALSGKIYL
jgi:hypothetical protein